METAVLIVTGFCGLAWTLAFLVLCDREKRFPRLGFLFDLMGGWLTNRVDRRDPWISTAVPGFMITLPGVFVLIALAAGR